MKKVFALFCAFALTPTFSAHAWIGGPFSNNSFFGAQGDDGVYEAVATVSNGLGLFRIVVGNSFAGVNPDGVQASVPSQQPNTGTQNTLAITVPGINSGNIIFGGLGNNSSNIWFFEGTSYFGTTIGTVNSAQGLAAGVASATNNQGQQGVIGAIEAGSFFQAQIDRTGRRVPVAGFSGTGELRISNNLNRVITFRVEGTKVSDQITFGL